MSEDAETIDMALRGSTKTLLDIIENSLRVIRDSTDKCVLIGRFGIVKRKIRDLAIRENMGKYNKHPTAKEYSNILSDLEKERAHIIDGEVELHIPKPQSNLPREFAMLDKDTSNKSELVKSLEYFLWRGLIAKNYTDIENCVERGKEKAYWLSRKDQSLAIEYMLMILEMEKEKKAIA